MMSNNHHGTLVVVGDTGVLITGPSGSGKSTLALKILFSCVVHGIFGRLVSDDQVLLSTHSGRLIGTVPEEIAGLIEVWGVGPKPIAYQPTAAIDLVVKLVAHDNAPRMNTNATVMMEGVSVPMLELQAQNAEGAVWAILAQLSQGLFAVG